MLIQQVDIELPNNKTIDYIHHLISTWSLDQYSCSPIGNEFDPWWAKLNLMEKAVVSRKFLSSGLMIDRELTKAIYSQYDPQEQSLYQMFYPQGTKRIDHWVQRCKKFNDDKFMGITPVPNRWSVYDRGVNLIYTLPGYNWTMRYFKYKDGIDSTGLITAHSYDDVELVAEQQITGGTWYRFDFTQDYLTEENWSDELIRIALILK